MALVSWRLLYSFYLLLVLWLLLREIISFKLLMFKKVANLLELSFKSIGSLMLNSKTSRKIVKKMARFTSNSSRTTSLRLESNRILIFANHLVELIKRIPVAFFSSVPNKSWVLMPKVQSVWMLVSLLTLLNNQCLRRNNSLARLVTKLRTTRMILICKFLSLVEMMPYTWVQSGWEALTLNQPRLSSILVPNI